MAKKKIKTYLIKLNFGKSGYRTEIVESHSEYTARLMACEIHNCLLSNISEAILIN